jgi:branched-chain amino acid aminotransferase
MAPERRVYWNGKFINESDAKVSIYDSSQMFGDTIFEMMRSFKGVLFKLDAHLERLYAGIKILRIPVKMTLADMREAVLATVKENRATGLFNAEDEDRVMINVTRGLLGIYEDVVGVEKGPNVIIADFPLRWTVASMGPLFDTGINAVITSQRAIPGRLLDPKIKNRSRIHYLMANIEASFVKGDNNWALLCDEDGFIAEGTGDNFFIVKDGKVISPEGRNILRGISRDYIKVLCRDLKIPYVEKNIEPYDVYTADEAFMTGTPFCMLPVTSLNGLKIGVGDVKAFYKFEQLLLSWGDTVQLNIAQQIKEYGKYKKENQVTPYQFKEAK